MRLLGGAHAKSYPKAARDKGVSAVVWMTCYAKWREPGLGIRSARPESCRVIFSNRSGLGFEPAAMSLVDHLRFAQMPSGGDFALVFTLTPNGPRIEVTSIPAPSGSPFPPVDAYVLNPGFRTDYPEPGFTGRVFPERAQRLDVEGSATVSCIIADGGGLDDCRVMRETPDGYGFGRSTLFLIPYVHTATTDPDGASRVGRPVRFSVRWGIPR